MDAALLGMTAEAKAMVVQRATGAPAKGYRFPTFTPHYQDYEPSADHLANHNSAVQWMAMQSGDDAAGTIVLLPAWPCEWDVSFKLRAAQNTTVTVDYAAGTFKTLAVDPPARKAAVKVANCVSAEDASAWLSGP